MTCSKCGETQTPYLDNETDKVYCTKCNNEIVNVTIFAKNQMKMNKQFRQKEKKSFSVKCDKCAVEGRPKLVNNDIVCSSCNKKLDKLTAPFVAMLKQQLKKVDQDI